MTSLTQGQKNLHTIDADTLTATPLPALRYVVDQLIPQGLHILAGAPKVGKSWLALWLCLQVAEGKPVWEFPTTQSTVLYLCLEDSYTRIQRRLFQLTEDAPATLHLANLSERIGSGLEDQIRQFLREHTDTALVVIDTLQKVRGASVDSSAYASDYRDLSALKQLADEQRVAVLLIHHLRKTADEDPLNMISGTTGISGATDSSFVLKGQRGSRSATLYCTGRDIEYRELPLWFSGETHTWELTEQAEEEQEPVDPKLVSLSEFLKALSIFDGTATQLSELWERQKGEQITPSVLAKRMVRYAGELESEGIHFTTSRTREVRHIHIQCDGSDGSDGKNRTGA